MKKEKKSQGFGIKERLKSLLLGALVISLVVLVAVYVMGSHVYETMAGGSASGESFNMLWSVQGGTEPRGLEPSRLLPEFVGYKQHGIAVMRASVGDANSSAELYGLIKPCLMELFGSGSSCRRLTEYEGKTIFSAARSADEFVYLRYHTPVLYQLIYAYAADQLIVSESDVASGANGSIGAYIHELIIVPETDLAAHRYVAYAADGKGNYYEFRQGDHVVSSSFYISKLASGGSDIATYEFDFAEKSRLASPQPVIKSEIIGDIITVEHASPSKLERMPELLRLFGYNPDKLDGYTDGDAQIYIDAYSQLRIEPDKLTFLTQDSHGGTQRGIGIDTLLGYTVEGTPTLFNKLTAADNLIERLSAISSSLTGGEASLCLGEVYSDGALLVIEYFPTYNNIRVGDEPHLRAVLTENTVCEVTLSLSAVKNAMRTELVLSPEYVLDKLITVDGVPKDHVVTDFGLKYLETVPFWTAQITKAK